MGFLTPKPSFPDFGVFDLYTTDGFVTPNPSLVCSSLWSLLFFVFGRFWVWWGLMGPNSPSPYFLFWFVFMFFGFLFILSFFGGGGGRSGRFRLRWGPEGPQPLVTVTFFHLFFLVVFVWGFEFRENSEK